MAGHSPSVPLRELPCAVRAPPSCQKTFRPKRPPRAAPGPHLRLAIVGLGPARPADGHGPRQQREDQRAQLRAALPELLRAERGQRPRGRARGSSGGGGGGARAECGRRAAAARGCRACWRADGLAPACSWARQASGRSAGGGLTHTASAAELRRAARLTSSARSTGRPSSQGEGPSALWCVREARGGCSADMPMPSCERGQRGGRPACWARGGGHTPLPALSAALPRRVAPGSIRACQLTRAPHSEQPAGHTRKGTVCARRAGRPHLHDARVRLQQRLQRQAAAVGKGVAA